MNESAAHRLAEKWERPAVALLLAWFAARLAWLALRIHPAIPPDEIAHFGLSLAWAGSWLVPPDGPETWRYGPIAGQPGLYYWLMGRLLALDVFPGTDLAFLRLMNAVLALLGAVVGLRWIALLSGNPVVRLLFLVLVTNTPMATALGAAVSYDNLANLLAALAIFHLSRFFQQRRLHDLLALSAALLAGTLTKHAFLPLAAILAILLAIHERRRAARWPTTLARPGWRHGALAALVLGLGVANLTLYGGNLVRYGTPLPDAVAVLGLDRALQHANSAYEYVRKGHRDGTLTAREAADLAARIENPVTRQDALNLLAGARRPARMDRVEYALRWAHRVLVHWAGYVGHRQLTKSPPLLYPLFAIVGFAALAFVRCWRPGDGRGLAGVAAALVGLYALTLVWAFHYPIYLDTGVLGIWLQGRYLFPVLVPFHGLVALYAVGTLPARAQAPVAVAIAVYFLAGDLPWLALRAPPGWV